MMLYSIGKAVGFPSGTGMRVLLSIIIGFLITFFITNKELITIMQGYTGLGVTIAVFVPFFILGAFTIMTARMLSPVGIYLQKIIWIIFTVYMILKTSLLWVTMKAIAAGTTAAGETVRVLGWFPVKVTPEVFTMAQNSDKGILITLIVASIAALFVMLGNNIVLRWFAKEELEAAIAAKKHQAELSSAYEKLQAEQMKKGG